MIEKMTRYNFILLNGEEEMFLHRLQELGVVDITRSSKPVDDNSADMLTRAEELRKAKDILESASFEGVQAESFECDDPASEVFELSDTLKRIGHKIDEVNKEITEREPWGEFEKEKIDTLESLGYTVRYYKTPKKSFVQEQWSSMVPLQVISEDAKNVWFVTVSDDKDYDFPIIQTKTPKGNTAEAKTELKLLESELQQVQGRFMGLKAYKSKLISDYSNSLEDLDRYLAKECSDKAVEGHILLLEGFAPAEEELRLTEEFDTMDMLWYKEDAVAENNPPIRLRNNWFTKMFSVLTDMYGRPEYNGFDPTPYISIFFLLFFGFCMGDAGYGLVLVLVGLALKKVNSFKDMAGLVVTLGAGTIVIGLLFHTFFSVDLLTLSWIPEGIKKFMLPSKIMDYDGTMVLAIIVGIFHLCVAMVVKTVYATKQKGFLGSLGIWGWTLLIVGGVAVAGVALTGVLEAAITKWVVIALGAISATGIFLLNNLHRNPLKNIGAGLWETYNTATGLLGDVLSYLRLYALGLAGAMLGQAFNSLGLMLVAEDAGIFNWVAFAAIVMVGHVLNLAMAALGAFVHPLRLNFLEFFKNSGYEISGRNYNPLTKTE